MFDFKLKFENFDKKVYCNLTNEQIRQKVLINCQIENDQLTYEDIWGGKIGTPLASLKDGDVGADIV